jgi:hypothetical protein
VLISVIIVSIMAENDNELSSKPLHSCSHEPTEARGGLLGALESPWKVTKRVIGMITYSDTPVDSPDAATDGPLGAKLASNRTGDTPNINSSGNHSGNSTEQLTLYQAFQGRISYVEEAFLAGQPLQASSASDRTPIHSVANDEQDLPLDNLLLVSRNDSSTQHEVPIRLYEYFRKIHETPDFANNMHIDGTTYHSMLCLLDELRAREILPYLVPQELEGMSQSKNIRAIHVYLKFSYG